MSADNERVYLDELERSADSLMISAFVNGELAANAGFNPVSRLEKYRHRAEFGISVKVKYWSEGIGSALLAACIEAAREAGYVQLELDVVESNRRAAALYERFGFVTYGVRERSFRYRDGRYEALRLMLLEL